MPKTTTTTKSAPAPSRGRTTFSDTVIETIAGLAVREVPGVYKLGQGVLGDAVARVKGTAGTSRGVHAEVGRKETAIDIDLVVEYGFNVHETASLVREKIAARVEEMTNLVCKEVNIAISDIHYESADEPTPSRRVE